MFIDSHAHLNYPDFEGEIDAVIARAQENNVKKIIDVGTTVSDSKKAIRLSEKYKGVVFAAAGLHPHDIGEIIGFDKQFAELQALIDQNKVVAIGECGLDYSRFFKDNISKSKGERKTQKNSFKKQLELALTQNVPVIVHSRKAEDDTFEILSDKKYAGLSGVVHCHTGTIDFAKKVLSLGFYIGITGIITFPNTVELMEVVKEIDINKILIETDSPFLAPVPYRGSRNEPAYVVRVAEKIAEIKGLSIEAVAKATSANAENLFKI